MKYIRNFLIFGSGDSYWLSFSWGLNFDYILYFVSFTVFLYVSDLPGYRRCLLEKTKTMLAQKQAEEAIVTNFSEQALDNDHGGGGKEEDHRDQSEQHSVFSVKSFLWHGGSAWDAWFSCASNQVTKFIQKFPLKPPLISSSFSFTFSSISFSENFAGCSSTSNSSILILSTGYGLRRRISDILRTRRKLDGVSNQCALHRVSEPERERECQLQEPCHTGLCWVSLTTDI